MVNEIIVKIIADRIISKGLNPKTKNIYTLDDIKNQFYKKAVIDYIENTSKM